MEDTRLGAILLETRLVPERRLRHCLEIQALTGGNRPLGQILVEQGVITRRVLDDLLRMQETRRKVLREANRQTVEPADSNDRLLSRAVEGGVSDLFVGEGQVPMVRLCGRLQALTTEPMAGPEVWEFAKNHLGPDAIDKVAQRGSLTRALGQTSVARGRVTAFRHLDGIGVSIRIHPRELRAPDTVGIDDRLAETARNGRGLVIVAGERNGGSTETFATLLEQCLATKGRSVHVLDRCFEYPTARADAFVTRRRIDPGGVGVDGALRAALREEPDVLFLGEVERGSLPLVLHAAEHVGLVVASVRAPSVVGAIRRILSMADRHERERTRMVLAGACLSILAVRTLPRADSRGMTLATELLHFDDTARGVLRSGSLDRISSLLRVDDAGCGHSMDRSLMELVRSRTVELGEAFAFAEDKGWMLDFVSEPGMATAGVGGDA